MERFDGVLLVKEVSMYFPVPVHSHQAVRNELEHQRDRRHYQAVHFEDRRRRGSQRVLVREERQVDRTIPGECFRSMASSYRALLLLSAGLSQTLCFRIPAT